MAVPKKKKSKSKTHSRKSANMRLAAPSRSICPR
ncbi:MAG: 50S ribosomal protein L32, partial [Ilumatobacter sp.]|nr:50S ribosomal protein L32 [Ilumatobacter sp.]